MRLRPVKPTGVIGLWAGFSLAEVLISPASAVVQCTSSFLGQTCANPAFTGRSSDQFDLSKNTINQLQFKVAQRGG